MSKKNSDDLYRKTLLVLIIIAIIISAIGTWRVLRLEKVVMPSTDSGQVSVVVEQPPQPPVVAGDNKVSVVVEKPPTE